LSEIVLALVVKTVIVTTGDVIVLANLNATAVKNKKLATKKFSPITGSFILQNFTALNLKLF
jgi:predicted small secreted protein